MPTADRSNPPIAINRARIRREAWAAWSRDAQQWRDGRPEAPDTDPSPNPALGDESGLPWLTPEQLSLAIAERAQIVLGWHDRLLTGSSLNAGPVVELAADLVDLSLAHPRRAASLAIHPYVRPVEPDGAEAGAWRVAHHAVATAALCAASACRMRWRRDETIALIASALIADVGLRLLQPDALNGTAQLDETETAVARAHPVVSAHLARRARGLPASVIRTIAQHHERPDGGGFPEGARRGAISAQAELLGVCDRFAGACAWRAYRPSRVATRELTELAREAKAGRLSPAAVGALAAGVGPLPVGSWVLLSDGRPARVAGAARRGDPHRPIVQPWGAWPEAPEAEIDLTGDQGLRVTIAGAIAPPEPGVGLRALARANNAA